MAAIGKEHSTKKTSGVSLLILCLMCVLINLSGAYVANHFELPLYLDTIGTIIAAVYSGSVPGMLVGLITNMLKAVQDADQMYYGALNMCTALAASWLAHKGIFKSMFKPLLTVPIFAMLTGAIGAVLTWFLNSGSFGGLAGPYAEQIYQTYGLLPFVAQLVAEFVLDVIDKLIVVLLVIVLLRLVPKPMKRRLRWQNVTKRVDDDSARVQTVKTRGLSLRTSVLLGLAAASVAIAGAATGISYFLFREATIDDHIQQAESLTYMAAANIDAQKVNEYLAKGEAAEGYKATEDMLYNVKNSSDNVEFVYVYKILDDGCHVVFDLDTEDVQGSDPGDVIEFEDAFMPYVPDLLAGKEIKPIISSDQYGWLLTVYRPVYDAIGNCQCYVGADIMMNLLSDFGYRFLARLLSVFFGFFVLTLGAAAKLIDWDILRPINAIASCTDAFAFKSDKTRAKSLGRLKDLDIRTHDEVENLYHSFVTMAEQCTGYIADIQSQTDTISQMQNGLIMVLADIVESRDQCTGDHVRKTAAYVQIIVEEMKRLGYYKDQLTDEFMQNVINSAPLHDIGKIEVPDRILNKPGKLTDREFEVMKSHTTAGAEILEGAIKTVPDSGYLVEAKNLAEFHHEKWNGKGYPYGLSGEQIPLSARIMAVADVFDALVSRRSYKKPFSFEKAMSIIQEDAGSHFDPLVAKAFLSAQSRVRAVMTEFDKINNPDGEDIDVDGSTDQKR